MRFTFQLLVSNREGTTASNLVEYLFAARPITPSNAPLVVDYNSTQCSVEYLFVESNAGSEILSFNLEVRDTIAH